MINTFMKKKINLIYQLNGPSIDDGVDIFKLSPLLLSLGELIQNSQEAAHPEGNKLGVNVKPFKKGSFVIELQLFAQSNLGQLIDFINKDSVTEIKELLEWLGIIGGSVMGVIGVYKFLKGKPKRFEEVGFNEVRITAKDDNSITVNRNVFNLFQNTSVQQRIYNIYGNFLGQEGVETVHSF